MEIFQKEDVVKILKNKFVVIIGDSIQRGIYKDLVLLLQQNRYLKHYELKAKGEHSFLHDELVEGGRKGIMSNGVAYKEVRQFCTSTFLIRFYFVTRCYNNYVESILKDLKEEPKPDVILMNSCLWDMTRYGREAIVKYKENLKKLFARFSQSLPPSCLVIWNTTLPISTAARGGFLVPEVEFMTTTLRLDIIEANYYAKQEAVSCGLDVLDLHFYLRHHLDKRVHDGIHWDFVAHRRITNLVLGHIAESWGIPAPKSKPVTFGSYGGYRARCADSDLYQPRQRMPPSYLSQQMPRNFSFGQTAISNFNVFLGGQNFPSNTPRTFPMQPQRRPAERTAFYEDSGFEEECSFERNTNSHNGDFGLAEQWSFEHNANSHNGFGMNNLNNQRFQGQNSFGLNWQPYNDHPLDRMSHRSTFKAPSNTVRRHLPYRNRRL